jgi:hypothetical protein
VVCAPIPDRLPAADRSAASCPFLSLLLLDRPPPARSRGSAASCSFPSMLDRSLI